MFPWLQYWALQFKAMQFCLWTYKISQWNFISAIQRFQSVQVNNDTRKYTTISYDKLGIIHVHLQKFHLKYVRVFKIYFSFLFSKESLRSQQWSHIDEFWQCCKILWVMVRNFLGSTVGSCTIHCVENLRSNKIFWADNPINKFLFF